MGQILSGVITAIGIWLVATPWTGWYACSSGARYLDVGLGILVVILGLVHLFRRAPGRIPGVDWVTLVVGIVLLVAGIFLPDRGGAVRASEIICGLLVIGISWVAVHLPASTVTKMVSIEGQVLLEMTDLLADERGIGMKVKLMGAMPATIYIKPNELWNLLGMVPAKVVFAAAREVLLPRRAPAEKGQGTKSSR